MLTLHIDGGSRSGEVVRFEGRRVTVGRHPDADLQFGPERDLEVSTHHAVLARDDRGWFVRDLRSRNGTWVDGAPVEGDRRLHGGETIRFGTDGPQCRVELSGTSTPPEASPPPTRRHPRPSPGPAGRDAPSAHASDAPSGQDAPPGQGAPSGQSSRSGQDAPSGQGSVTARIRTEVSKRTRGLTVVLAGLTLAFTIALAAVGITSRRRAEAWEEERRALQSRLDSVLAASESTAGALDARIEGLSDALAESRDRVRELRTELEQARSAGTAEARELRTRLQTATAALERQQLAASLDFESIRERNGLAVAQAFVERDDGTVVTGTAFAVRADGTLATVRHLVADPAGEIRAVRIAIQFAGSDQVWPAELVRVDPAADLAVLRALNVEGPVPTVVGVNARADSLAPGTPVAVLGFPLGGAGGPEGADDAEGPPRPLLSAGVIDRIDSEILEVQGYGERGASGSPVFDATGRVVGVVYGGRTVEDGGRRLVGVAAGALVRLLSEIPESSREVRETP